MIRNALLKTTRRRLLSFPDRLCTSKAIDTSLFQTGYSSQTWTGKRASTTLFSVQPANTATQADSTLYDDTPAYRSKDSQIPNIGQPIIIDDNISQVLDEAKKSTEKDIFEGLKSRPVPGGNWDPENPLGWTKDFGRRSPDYEERLKPLIRLKPGDEGYFDVASIRAPRTTIVRTQEQAQKVLNVLMNADPGVIHACDTEVMDIDLDTVGPVGNGYVTCASIYSGPDFDYGLGDGPGTRLWIDNLDDACGILQEFKVWFEDPRFLKVWHNYGFDRHVMWNEGIDCQGFGGDTMHMARLQDSSRSRADGRGYSLAALTSELFDVGKVPMKELFGVPRLRQDGSPGSIIDIPPVEVLQRDPKFRSKFIDYSCDDAEGTWNLHMKLVQKLKDKEWKTTGTDLYDYYWHNMREFGEVLTDMERRGIRVDAKDYLASVEEKARQDRAEHLQKFRNWAARKIGPDGLALNPASSIQLATFLFGGTRNTKTGKLTETERVFRVARDEVPEDALEAYRQRDEAERQSANGKQ